MAFELPTGLLGIEFETEALAGLEIWFRPPTVDAFAAVIELNDYAPIEQLSVDAIKAMRPVCREFASLLDSWNLERKGVSVPVTAFLTLPAAFVIQVARTWCRVTVGLPQVPPVLAEVIELPEFDESQLPMEALA